MGVMAKKQQHEKLKWKDEIYVFLFLQCSPSAETQGR